MPAHGRPPQDVAGPVWFVWMAVAAFALSVGFELWQTRQADHQRAAALVTSYVRLVEEHASSTFDRTSLILTNAVHDITAADLDGARTMSPEHRAQVQERLLTRQREGAGIVSISVTDADGIVFANTVGQPPGGFLGDRKYFLAVKAGNADTLAVSEAIKGRISNKWGIQVARRINRPDGGFGGMIVANLGLSEYFDRFYGTLSFSGSGVIELRDTDDRIMARFPHREEAINARVPAIDADDVISREPDEVVYRRASAIDGLMRITAERKLPGYPIHAVVGIGEDEYLAGWRGSVKVSAIVLTVAFLAALTTTNAMRRKAQLEGQVRAEEARRQQAERRQVEEQAKAAEASSHAKSDLLAIVSHEIRTPLNGVLGMSELLAQTALSPEQEDYLATIRQCGESLSSLLNDILDYTKIEAGRLELEVGDLDLRRLAEGAVTIVRQPAAAKGVALTIELSDQVPRWVRGDAARLRQILVNLLSNAVKFTATGEIVLAVACRPEGGLRFSVSDTGIGIPAEVLPNLFKPFSQADFSVTRRYGGTGLGLAICRRLVEAMGGSIGVDSRPGSGSVFWFILDLPEGRAGAPAPRLPGPGRPLGVLLAEDNPVNQRLAKAMLERGGHSVTIAEDGAAALARLAERRFDLVLMDIHMPGMDGFEATRRIRASTDPEIAGIPVIALTADALTEEARHWREAGMTGFIAKPFTMGKLEEALLALDQAV